MKAEEYLKENASYEIKLVNVFENTKRDIIKLLQDFARMKCKEQREICADADVNNLSEINTYTTILNSPEPEL